MSGGWNKAKPHCLCHVKYFGDNLVLLPVSSAVLAEMTGTEPLHPPTIIELPKSDFFVNNNTTFLSSFLWKHLRLCSCGVLLVLLLQWVRFYSSAQPNRFLFSSTRGWRVPLSSIIAHKSSVQQLCPAHPEPKTNLVALVLKDLQQARLRQKARWV